MGRTHKKEALRFTKNTVASTAVPGLVPKVPVLIRRSGVSPYDPHPSELCIRRIAELGVGLSAKRLRLEEKALEISEKLKYNINDLIYSTLFIFEQTIEAVGTGIRKGDVRSHPRNIKGHVCYFLGIVSFFCCNKYQKGFRFIRCPGERINGEAVRIAAYAASSLNILNIIEDKKKISPKRQHRIAL